MTVQITVRIPDEQAAFVDRLVQEGKAPSRASAIAEALRHEQRRLEQEHDAAIYASLAGQPDPDDLDGLAAWAARQPLDLDD